MNELRTIRLYGVLGNLFGRVHRLAVATPGEAVRALCVQLPGFESWLNTSRQRGLTWAVFSGTRNLSQDDLTRDRSPHDIRIAPVLTGSKRGGLFQTIFGAVLVAVGAVLSFTPAAAASPFLMKMGGAMMIGGIIQMLSPQTKGLAMTGDADNKPSYAFGGVTNTAAQGYPVPVLYGKRRIGGAVISASIITEDC
ncbi:tail assembly protein [Salmonella enterica]